MSKSSATLTVNQLVIVTASASQAHALTERLTRDEFYVTQIDTSGGLLYEATVSLLIGVDQARLPRLLNHIREYCATEQRFVMAYGEVPLLEAQPMMLEAEVGGATVYVLDVEHFEQF
ncbi:MAG: cyclic-di-AMP receptor [Anaerolineae bacterium]|nr:cyclic-di-AMP receptor [Anaerolineae bacterium]